MAWLSSHKALAGGHAGMAAAQQLLHNTGRRGQQPSRGGGDRGSRGRGGEASRVEMVLWLQTFAGPVWGAAGSGWQLPNGGGWGDWCPSLLAAQQLGLAGGGSAGILCPVAGGLLSGGAAHF